MLHHLHGQTFCKILLKGTVAAKVILLVLAFSAVSQLILVIVVNYSYWRFDLGVQGFSIKHVAYLRVGSVERVLHGTKNWGALT